MKVLRMSGEFNYEMAEIDSLRVGPYKIKLYDDTGNSTKWLTLDVDTFHKIRDALIEQGKDKAERRGLE
jgi:hypothetical protein